MSADSLITEVPQAPNMRVQTEVTSPLCAPWDAGAHHATIRGDDLTVNDGESRQIAVSNHHPPMRHRTCRFTSASEPQEPVAPPPQWCSPQQHCVSARTSQNSERPPTGLNQADKLRQIRLARSVSQLRQTRISTWLLTAHAFCGRTDWPGIHAQSKAPKPSEAHAEFRLRDVHTS